MEEESEFWKDLRENLEDPIFREAYIKECEEVERIDMETNKEAEEGKDPEDRYEAIELILKSRPDGAAWFDVIFDMITETCEGTDSDEDDCTCGMETMSGSGGTLKQCYDYTTTVGYKLQPIDLARVILFLNKPLNANYVTPEDRNKVLEWAQSEVKFETYFENREWEFEECPDCGETNRITEGTECPNCGHVFSDEEEAYELPEEFEPYFSNEELPEGVLNILRGSDNDDEG